MPQFELHDTGDLKRLAKDLRQAATGKELRKEFTGQVRAALRPVVADAKAAYRSAPSMGHDSMARKSRARPALWVLLAKATRLEVRTGGKQAGIRVRVDGRKMPDRMKSLPRYWEGERETAGRGRWRHPVFGDRDTWVQQPSRPTFYPVVLRHEPQIVGAVNRVLNEVARKLERGTV